MREDVNSVGGEVEKGDRNGDGSGGIEVEVAANIAHLSVKKISSTMMK